MSGLLYRADKREFAPGDYIATAGEFTGKHKLAGQLAEALLESLRPSVKPERSACLMLFEDEARAREHWSLMENGILYSVVLDGSEVLHRGDMQLVDDIGAELLAGRDAAHLAAAYWRSELSVRPCIELLVAKAKVSGVVSRDQRERRNELRAAKGLGPAPKTAHELLAESRARMLAKQMAERG